MPTSTTGIKHSSSLSSLNTLEKDSDVSSRLSERKIRSSKSDEASKAITSGRTMYKWGDTLQQNSANGKRKKKHVKPVTINISGTRYDVVRYTAIEAGYTISKDEDMSAFVLWNDAFVSTDRIFELKPFQRINHFPGMGEVTRKDCLARNIAKMQKTHSTDFNFTPKTWILPSDYVQMMNYAKDLKTKKKVRTFIAKPPNAAQGHGICLYRNLEKIATTDSVIVQEYIDKPLLIEGYKFDLRIYVLITSCDPLRVFLFNDGLVRLSTEKYVTPQENNLANLFMHLTNYSINKHNENYEKGSTIETGSKRSFKFFNDYLRQHDYDVVLLWKNISDVIIRTFIMAEPHVLHAYRMSRPGAPPASDSVCFEILGLDIIVDRKLRPWLLEINRSPSFGTDEEIDHNVKSSLLFDTFKLLNIKISDRRRNIAAEKAEAQKRLLRPNKRSIGSDRAEMERKRELEKRKDELRELLEKVKKASAREDFENRNIGRFRRIFPTEDKHRQERYTSLLLSSFEVFLSGRVGGIQKEIQHLYNSKLREQDIVDLLAECESDGYDPKNGLIQVKPAKPLSSMPVASQSKSLNSSYDEHSEGFYDCDDPDLHRVNRRKPPTSSHKRDKDPQFMLEKTICRINCDTQPTQLWNAVTPSHKNPPQKSSNILTLCTDMVSSNNTNKVFKVKERPTEELGIMSNSSFQLADPLVQEQELLTFKTLAALNEMNIKFPGKTEDEAERILDSLRENWRYHKPRIASYWLVKLDSIKRRKVIDIVRSNVRATVQRIWRLTDVDALRLFRVFSRVFSRLLWSHGQGLWNCFSHSGNSTWEVIFSKSSDRLELNELNCCRRIAQLCQDCLLIVYQFAQEAQYFNKNMNINSLSSENNGSGFSYRPGKSGYQHYKLQNTI